MIEIAIKDFSLPADAHRIAAINHLASPEIIWLIWCSDRVFENRRLHMIAKIADATHLVSQGAVDPNSALPEIKALAASESWQEREVAATALVEISKRQSATIVSEMMRWARDRNPKIRRAASEGLRDVARKTPEIVIPVLELLRTDPALYVRKSVGNALRNASKKHPEVVLDLCRRWAKTGNAHTNWIIKDGLKKLRETKPREIARLVDSLQSER